MIHYHGSPISGNKIDCCRFFRGRHAFVSFANPAALPSIADVSQSFALDNGAFTAWKQGGTVDYDGYLVWVTEWHNHPGFDFAIIPDVIDGTDSDNDDLIFRWPAELPGVPVWHLHERIERLQGLCDEYRTVALGSSGAYASPGTESWWYRMGEAMEAICDDKGRPQCRLHGLRMLNPDLFSRLPLASADSCNAGINAGSIKRFGMYTPPSAGQRADIIAERIEAFNSPPAWVRSNQLKLE